MHSKCTYILPWNGYTRHAKILIMSPSVRPPSNLTGFFVAADACNHITVIRHANDWIGRPINRSVKEFDDFFGVSRTYWSYFISSHPLCYSNRRAQCPHVFRR